MELQRVPRPQKQAGLGLFLRAELAFLNQGLADGGRRGNTGSRRPRGLTGDDVDLPCSLLCQLFDPLGRRRRFDSRLGLLARPFVQYGSTSSLSLLSNIAFLLR
ncbi:hypothetical protein ACFX1S_046741 [Malus domestica]